MDGIDILLFATLSYLLYKYFTRNFNYWEKRRVPSITPLPFFGNFISVMFLQTGIPQFLSGLYAKTSYDFLGIWIFNTPHLIVRDPDIIKHILVKDFQFFSDRAMCGDPKIDPIASNTLMLMRGRVWKTMRMRLSPLFSPQKIKKFVASINIVGHEMGVYLNEAGCVDAKDVASKFATDVITSCAFGVEAEAFKRNDSEFKGMGKRLFEFNLENAFCGLAYYYVPSLVKIFKLSLFHSTVNSFCRESFSAIISQRETAKRKRNDVIDLIVDWNRVGQFDGVDFVRSDMAVATAFQFFVAGFETITTIISFALYELCVHPDVQRKLHEEIHDTLRKFKNEISYETIKSLKFLDMVIKEVLRKYPVLPYLDRRCTKNYKIPNSDVVIEKGTAIIIPLVGLHYDPKYFPEPNDFVPERFAAENITKRPGGVYLPFGGGPHSCLGERLGLLIAKLGVLHVLRSFKVERTQDTPVPIVFDTKTFTLQSKVGLPMRFIHSDS